MTNITTGHLTRTAFVYVRQSTSDQLLNNHESRRRQYGLVARARALGWSAVEVIDKDLGCSGSGIARPVLRSCSRRFARAVSAPRNDFALVREPWV
jgi:DNA invertase Pin-like site-specific DNA recombinase